MVPGSSRRGLIRKIEWKVQIAQDGLLEFVASAYLDLAGEPRRNTMRLRAKANECITTYTPAYSTHPFLEVFWEI